ncbi:MAG: polysaccharide biosynthesis C-terminal domain-containing protein, partial [Anaerovoracaceae bacterium]
IMNAIDVGIVMRRLQETGWSYEAANSMYGQLTGMAGPLINFPQVLTQAVAMSLVPAVAAAYKKKDMEFLRENVQTGLRMAIIIGFPCAFGLMSLAEPIMLLLYPMQKESAVSAAPCLFVMAAGVIFLSTVQTLTGVLQGVGKQMIPVRNLFIGAIAKVFITYTLTGVESINVKGAAMGTVAAYIIAASLNLMAVKKYTGARFDLKLTYLKPAAATIVMSAAAIAIHRVLLDILGNSLATLLAVAAAASVYCVMLFLTKSITREEIATLPKGKTLLKIADKFKR